MVFVGGRFIGMRAVEHAFARHAGQQPGQFWNLRDVRLPVKSHHIRIQSSGDPTGSDFQRGALNAGGLIAFDQCVVVRQKIKTFGRSVAAGLHGGPNGTHIIAQMRRAGGGDAGQDAGAFRIHDVHSGQKRVKAAMPLRATKSVRSDRRSDASGAASTRRSPRP